MPGPTIAAGPGRDIRWVLVGLVVVVLVILLVQEGCSTGPQRTIRGSTLRLTLRDYAIDPRNVLMRAGLIRFTARNVGRNVHSVRVVSDDNKRGDRRSTFGTTSDPLRPGDRGLAVVVCLGPGRYRIISGQSGDEDLGMVSNLQVRGRPSCAPVARGH